MDEVKFQVGDVVTSKVNKLYKGSYTVTKVNKTTAHVKSNMGYEQLKQGVLITEYYSYKNVRLSILKKVS